MLWNIFKNGFAGAFKGRGINRVFSGSYKKNFSFKKFAFLGQAWVSFLGAK